MRAQHVEIFVVEVQHGESVRRQLSPAARPSPPRWPAPIRRTRCAPARCGVTTAMSGRRMSRSGAISPGWLMPASMTPKAQSRASSATLSGRPISLLKFPAGARRLADRRQQIGDQFLRRGLAHAAGHAHDARGHRRAVRRREPPQRGEHVVHAQEESVRRKFLLGKILAHDGARAGGGNRREKIVAVGPLALQREEQAAGLRPAAIHARARATAPAASGDATGRGTMPPPVLGNTGSMFRGDL